MEKKTVVKSLIYKFTERFAVKGIGLVIQIVLARHLLPEYFGQLTLLIVFSDLSLVLIDGGLNTALIQSREVDDRDYSTVFFITLALSAVMIAVLHLAAPAIARYYKSPALVMPLRVYSFSLILSSFNSIQMARLQRELRFREIMFCNLAAAVAAGVFAVALMYAGAGLWTLVAYYFMQVAACCLAMLLVLRWFPHGRFSPDSARRLYGFGIRMLAASLIQSLYYNLRSLIIGKKFSTTDLAYYDRGQRFSSTLSVNLDTAIQNVMFPVLSRSQDDPEQLRALFRRTKMLGAFVIFPVTLGLAAVAEPLVLLLLTEKWAPCVIYVQLLCAGDMMMPLITSNLIALKAMGRGQTFARQEMARRAVMLSLLLVSVIAFHSVPVIAASYALGVWLDVLVTSVPMKKYLGYTLLDQLRDVWKSFVSALVMAAAVYLLGTLALPLALKLALQVLLGAAVYAGLSLLLKNESLTYTLTLLRGLRHKAG